jgi:predicted DNA-binding protein (MmcQ/YjbR family)
MSVHSCEAFTKLISALPATTMVEQWGSHVAKVGGKVFALIATDGSSIVFKVTEMSFEGLTEIEGIGQAAYFAKRQWVSVDKGAALSDADLKAYIAASHRMIAGKLTRKLRAELGISEA